MLDASVVVKWYSDPADEPNQGKALDILDDLSQDRIIVHCPDLVCYELGNVLARKSKDPAICLESFLAAPVSLHPPDRGLLRRSLELCSKGLMFYDAAYIALAESMNHPLVSADGNQLRRAGTFGIPLERYVHGR